MTRIDAVIFTAVITRVMEYLTNGEEVPRTAVEDLPPGYLLTLCVLVKGQPIAIELEGRGAVSFRPLRLEETIGTAYLTTIQ